MELKKVSNLDELIEHTAYDFEEDEEMSPEPSQSEPVRFRASIYVSVDVPDNGSLEDQREVAKIALEEMLSKIAQGGDVIHDDPETGASIYNPYIGGVKHDPRGAGLLGGDELRHTDW